MNQDDIENELAIIRAGLACAPSSSTNTAACAALVRLSEGLLVRLRKADQPATTGIYGRQQLDTALADYYEKAEALANKCPACDSEVRGFAEFLSGKRCHDVWHSSEVE